MEVTLVTAVPHTLDVTWDISNPHRSTIGIQCRQTDMCHKREYKSDCFSSFNSVIAFFSFLVVDISIQNN